MNFVDDVDLELGIGGRVFAGLAQFAHLLDAVVAGTVDFQNIQRATLGDFLHARVAVVEINAGTAGAVQRLGENACNRRFARAARPAKQVGMGNAFLADGVGERLRDVFLSDDVGETLWAVFAGDDLVGHFDLRFTIYARFASATQS